MSLMQTCSVQDEDRDPVVNKISCSKQSGEAIYRWIIPFATPITLPQYDKPTDRTTPCMGSTNRRSPCLHWSLSLWSRDNPQRSLSPFRSSDQIPSIHSSMAQNLICNSDTSGICSKTSQHSGLLGKGLDSINLATDVVAHRLHTYYDTGFFGHARILRLSTSCLFFNHAFNSSVYITSNNTTISE